MLRIRTTIITNKIIPAFTLTEIVVATLLSAILIGLVVSAFSFLLGHMRSETVLMDKIENTFILESCLANNSITCDSINAVDNHLNFYRDGVSDYSIEFSGNCIVLHLNEITDTIKLSYSDLWYSIYDGSSNLISEVNFKVNIGILTLPLKISKEYEGLILVNSKAIDHEN